MYRLYLLLSFYDDYWKLLTSRSYNAKSCSLKLFKMYEWFSTLEKNTCTSDRKHNLRPEYSDFVELLLTNTSITCLLPNIFTSPRCWLISIQESLNRKKMLCHLVKYVRRMNYLVITHNCWNLHRIRNFVYLFQNLGYINTRKQLQF